MALQKRGHITPRVFRSTNSFFDSERLAGGKTGDNKREYDERRNTQARCPQYLHNHRFQMSDQFFNKRPAAERDAQRGAADGAAMQTDAQSARPLKQKLSCMMVFVLVSIGDGLFLLL